jgi:hypothetical protein
MALSARRSTVSAVYFAQESSIRIGEKFGWREFRLMTSQAKDTKSQLRVTDPARLR